LNEVADRIVGEIREKGVITFARFMELALYCPNCGYYEKEEDRIGRRGDYFTSTSVGGLLGELLAFQFAEWCGSSQGSGTKGGVQGLGSGPVQIVEAGAHDGRLAGDVLTWISHHRPASFERLQYWILEPSTSRLAWQRRGLAGFGDKVRWASDLAELRTTLARPTDHGDRATVRGVIFCNELLDAMPVHRLGWDVRQHVWFEWGVALRGEEFVWTRMKGEDLRRDNPESKVASPIAHLQHSTGPEVLEVLPDGFSIEVCPAAEQWWHEAANALRHGRLVSIDYGFTSDELLMPERKAGTLRAYHHHRLSSDVLAHPGEQDITAHVNFAAIQAVGKSAGLTTESFLTQAQFLTGIAARAWQAPGSLTGWTPEHTRQFQTLTHPEHLGRSFRVLVQSRL
jgi:SAM-dependent MidA family methyltransferase